MYGYIIGTVVSVNSSSLIVENNNIGYIINTHSPYSFDIGCEYKIYTYQYVKEDEISLYGFINEGEKELFLKLISVKGVGCKMALPILATGTPSSVGDAIERENIVYLKKFPKIGDKVARQIILDLKGKFDVKSEVEDNYNADELTEALLVLGYKKQDVKKVVSKVDLSLKIEDQIKEGLKLLLK